MPTLTVFEPPPLPSRLPNYGPKSPNSARWSNDTTSTEEGPAAVPTVLLVNDTVSDVMAAHLAMRFLGHVLFLKAQIPMPIQKLQRLPIPTDPSRATKKRLDFATALDVLESHLHTTFTALSAALAKFRSPADTSKAHLVFAVGQNASTSKARVVFGIDGLEVKLWGQPPENEVVEELSDEEEGVSGSEETEPEDSFEKDDTDNNESFEVSDPPSSPNPNPSSSLPSSRSTSPCFSSPPSSSSHSSSPRTKSSSPLSPLPPLQLSYTSRSIPSRTTHADTEATLHAADRLMSHTLARSAGKRSPGTVELSEMSPTRTHILLRAPRRFSHPAWTPRRELHTPMEKTLNAFLRAGEAVDMKRTKKKDKIEGVWIKGRGKQGSFTAEKLKECGRLEKSVENEAQEVAGEVNEDDEMLWWSWDGKLVGFSDW